MLSRKELLLLQLKHFAHVSCSLDAGNAAVQLQLHSEAETGHYRTCCRVSI